MCALPSFQRATPLRGLDQNTEVSATLSRPCGYFSWGAQPGWVTPQQQQRLNVDANGTPVKAPA